MENTKKITITLTPREIDELRVLSIKILGKENKSGIIRYMLTHFKSKQWCSVVANGMAYIIGAES